MAQYCAIFSLMGVDWIDERKYIVVATTMYLTLFSDHFIAQVAVGHHKKCSTNVSRREK